MHEILPIVSQENHFKIVASRCQILRLKCTKFDFGWGSAPDPAGMGSLQRSPDLLAGFKGPTSKGEKVAVASCPWGPGPGLPKYFEKMKKLITVFWCKKHFAQVL